jgi:hypothetical protein
VVMLTVTLVAMLDGVDGVGGKLHAVWPKDELLVVLTVFSRVASLRR